ncbi:MAG TPA: NIPSNAP family protein [Tepidisphaeraceae bacterium]|nr:NIPSNAP family protein [Tepidisphaeraceae bacterium]
MSTAITRRHVLAAMTATVGVAVIGETGAGVCAAVESPAKENPMAREFYELRALRLRRGPMSARLDQYLKDAFIPAARRAGCGQIGAFNIVIGQGNPTTYVVIPHPSVESFVSLPETLAQDADYTKAASDFRALPATDPPYVNQEVQLLKAFAHFPCIEAPEIRPRIFELRTYRSHSRSAGLKKIEMFDTGGEIAIFRRAGLTPVFFAQALTGAHLQCLTYMLTFPDLAAREKSWNAFRTDPDWKKLSSTPGYTDAEIVVDIDNQILAPTAYSQI